MHLKILCKKGLSMLCALAVIITLIIPVTYIEASAEYTGNSLRFDSADGEYAVTEASVEYTPVTMEAWIKLDASAGQRQVVMGNYSTGSENSWSLEVNTDGTLRFYQRDDGASVSAKFNTTDNTINVCTGEWMLISVVRDIASGQVLAYVDGELAATYATSAMALDDKSTHATYFGTDLRKTYWLDGEVGEVRLWSDVRTADEISEYASKTVDGTEEGLSHAWILSEPDDLYSETVFEDLVSNGIDVVAEGYHENEDAPTLTADTTDNVTNSSIEITFEDDSDWRAAISEIDVDGTALSDTLYSISSGSITIDGSVFTSADDYEITVSADGYKDAAVTQSISATTVGYTGTSLHFDSDGSEYAVTEASVEYTPVTMEAWIKLDPSENQRQIIMGNYSSGSENSWSLEVNTDGTLRFYQRDDGTSISAKFNTTDNTINVCTGEWMLISVVRDITNGQVLAYVDGELAATYATSAMALDDKSTHATYFGTDLRKTYWLDGEIGEVRLWGDVRTAGEISEYVSKTVDGTEDGLSHAWIFSDTDELGAETVFEDLVNGGVDVEAEGFEVYEEPVEIPDMDFDISSGVSFPDNASQLGMQKRYDSAPLTFEAIIKLSADVNGRAGVICGNYKNNDYTYDEAFVNFEISSDGHPRLYWQKDWSSVNASMDSSMSVIFDSVDVRTDDWVYLAITFDPDTDTAACYVNGVKVAEETGCTFTPDFPAQALLVGGDYRLNNDLYFKGEIASLRMWADVRTADEISANITELTGGTEDLLGAWDFAESADGIYEDVSGNGNYVSDFADWIEADFADGDYSMVVLPDTQFLAESYPQKFYDLTNWIADNQAAYNIEAVLHLGDVVNTPTSTSQWQVAQNAMTTLDDVVPYIVMTGNHDESGKVITCFDNYFPYSKYSQMDYFGGSMTESLENAYYFIEAGGRRYMIFALGFAPEDDVLEWVNEQIDAEVAENPDTYVIIDTHAYMNWDGDFLAEDDIHYPSSYYSDANNGDDIWETVGSKHENVVLCMGGHIGFQDLAWRTDTGDAGNEVVSMLCDSQGMDSAYNGLGMLMLLTFHEDSNEVDVNWYSVSEDALFRERNQFTIELTDLNADYADAPTLTADTSDNLIDNNIEIIFPDDGDWRADITKITVDGTALTEAQYTVSSGCITIDGSVFAAADAYTIVVFAEGYDNAVLTQAIEGAAAPVLTADTTDTVINTGKEITFEDDADWRAAITEIDLGETALSDTLYTISAGSITIDGSVFNTADDYTITVLAHGYVDATVIQSVTYPALEYTGTSLYFDSDYEEYAVTEESIEYTPVTMEAWIKLDASESQRQIIMGNYSNGSEASWSLEVNTDGTLRFWEKDNQSVSAKFNTAGNIINICTGEWMFVSVVRDIANNQVLAYVNGELAGTYSTTSMTKNGESTHETYFGTDLRKSMWLNGEIGEVRLWSDVRTAEQISEYASVSNASLVEDGDAAEGLSHAWVFSEPDNLGSTTLFDDLVTDGGIDVVAEGFADDTTAPMLTAGTASRTSSANATVTFAADETGTYYYTIVEDGTAAPEASDVISSGTSGACDTGSNTISITTLSGSTAKDIYIVAADGSGNTSDLLQMDIAKYSSSSSSGGSTSGSSSGSDYDTNGTEAGATTKLAPEVTVTDGGAAADIDQNEMDDAISAAAEEGESSVVIDATTDETVTKSSVTLPSGSASGMVSGGLSLTVKTSNGTFDIDNSALNAIGGTGSGEIEISVERLDEDGLSDNNKELVGDHPVFDLTVTVGGTQVTDFGNGTVTVSLPYTPTDGEDTDNLTVYYIDDDGNAVEMAGAFYDASSGCVVFETNHFSTFAIVFDDSICFDDVDEDDWFYEAVMYAAENGLFSGTSSTTFDPNADMTRAMLVTVLYRLEGEPAITGSNGFTDVQDGRWYTDAVVWASENKIVSGYGGGLFGTGDSVTREQMATILYNYAVYKGYAVTEAADLAAFDDIGDISSWASAAMGWANGEGLITGVTDTTLDPSGSATRAQAATILMRFVEGVVG